jgi:hypothetical protein
LRRLFYLAAPAAVGAGLGERHDDGEHPCRGAVDLRVSGALQIASTLLSGSEKIVPGSAPLYVYADTMNDFNHYTGGERMPMLASLAAVGALIAKGENGFMLIKDRDLKRLAQIPREWIVASDRNGSTSWYLIELKRRS